MMNKEMEVCSLKSSEVDWSWYWRGYSVGANTRKKLRNSPDKIVNIGRQGITTTLSQNQKRSFILGLYVGRGKIVQNFDIVKVIQYQDKNAHKSKGDYLSLSIGKAVALAGDQVDLPLYISNNSVDNRGFCGFQAKIKYDPNNLTLNTILNSSLWTSTFNYQHDAGSGIVLIQGLRDNVGYEDIVVGWLNFTVKSNAPNSNVIYLQGPSGTGQGSDIITKINGEFYYIMPLNLENGEIKLDGETKESEPVYVGPMGSSSDSFGEEVDFTYEFDCDLTWVEGSGSGAGASMWVTIRFGDGTSTQVEIPLQDGSHHYKGKIPIKLPSIKPGPVVIEYEVKPNDEDDIYYWFIKVGALWGFETTIPRDEVGELPILEPHVDIFEWLRFYSYFIITKEAPPSPGQSDISISEFFNLFSDLNYQHIHNTILSFYSALCLKAGYKADGVYVPPLTDVEVEEIMGLLSEIGITDVHYIIHEIEEVLGLKSEDNVEMKLDSGFSISYE